MKEEVLSYFVEDLDYFINKIINIKNLYSNFEPSIVTEEDILPNIKIKTYLPNKLKKIAYCMNSHIRLSMYDPKQFFGIHKDGINFDKDNKQRMSYATLNIFLNDDFEGGATTFYEKDKTAKFVCKPRTGRGGFFYSQQYHEGNKIISGNKYLLRTDFMINHNKK